MMTMGLKGLVTRMGRGGTVFTLYVRNIGGKVPGCRYEYMIGIHLTEIKSEVVWFPM